MVVQLLRPAQSPNSVLHDRSRMVLGEALKDYKKYFEGFIVLCPAQVSHYKDYTPVAVGLSLDKASQST